MSSSSGDSSGQVLVRRLDRKCTRKCKMKSNQSDKMAAGESAGDWRFLLRADAASVLPGSSRASIKPEDLCTAEKGKMTPPSNGLNCLLFFLHTVLNFYSFSSFLPSDGLLCVQAVGKFPVMVRSSTTNNPPPTHTHTETHHRTHSLRCPSLSAPGSIATSPALSVPLPVPLLKPGVECSLI